jgi:hypothetical protein
MAAGGRAGRCERREWCALPDRVVRNLDSSSLAAVRMAFQAVSRDALPVALVKAAATLGLDFTEKAAAEVVRRPATRTSCRSTDGSCGTRLVSPVTPADGEEVRELAHEQLARTFYRARSTGPLRAGQRVVSPADRSRTRVSG